MKEATNKFMAAGQDQAQGQIPPSVISRFSLVLWAWVASPKLPQVGVWDSSAPGEQEQGRFMTWEIPRLSTVCSLELGLFPLSQREHPGISQCQDIKEEITTSCLTGLIDSRPLYSTRSPLRETREVQKNQQRILDVPGCEEGRDHLHPGSPPGSNFPAGPTPLESLSGLWIDLSPRGIFYVTQLLHLVHTAQDKGRADVSAGWG